MLLGAPILSLVSKVLWWFQTSSSDTDSSAADQKFKPSLASPAGRGRAPDAAGLLERSKPILGEGSTRTRIPKTRQRAGCSPEEVRPRGGLWETRPSEYEGVHFWHFEYRGRKRSSSV